VWLVVGVVICGLVIAASSESVRVWTNPEPSGSDAPAVVDADPAPSRTVDEPGERSTPGWVGEVLRVLAIGLFGAIVIAGVFAATQARPAAPRWRWTPPGRRDEAFADPLPDADDRPVRVDAVAARSALSHGPPRNAIVACWMQLERDIADAGIPRRSSETSGEYVERVVGRASVDPAPIGELAALYREARFSHHELDDEQRDRATLALDAVVAAMRDEVPA
jgi:hypothetical protein